MKTEVRRHIHVLLIDTALLEDTAEFTFKAKNNTGEASETFNLVIQSKINHKFVTIKKHSNKISFHYIAPPVLFKALDPAINLKKGEEFVLETSYSGFPVPTATW